LNRKNKGLITGLGLLQVLIGLGAVAGGLGLILDPSGSNLGMPLSMLKNTPFSTFLLPGIVLLTVNGFGSLAGAAATFKRHRRAAEIAMALGLFLVVWIMLQVFWFSGFHWLHWLYLSLGFVELMLGWLLRSAFRKTSRRGKV
jgi:hypothetical protein